MKKVLVFVTAMFLIFGAVWAHLFYLPTEERKFIYTIENNFKNKKEVIYLKDFLNFPWSEVCFFSHYNGDDKIRYVNDKPVLKFNSSRQHWALVFINNQELVKVLKFKNTSVAKVKNINLLVGDADLKNNRAIAPPCFNKDKAFLKTDFHSGKILLGEK